MDIARVSPLARQRVWAWEFVAWSVSHRSAQSFFIAGLGATAPVCAFLALATTANAFPGPDAQCPHGWDTRNNTCLPDPTGAGNGGGANDAACQATAQFGYCQRSAYVGCWTSRIEFACRLLQLSYADPNTFQQIMSAQKACNLDGNQQACAFLMQYKGVYY